MVSRPTLDVLDELLAAWQAYQHEVIPRPRRTPVTPRQWAIVWACTCHAYDVARYLRGSIQQPALPLAAMPTARAIFESSITACWTAHNPEGAEAIANDYGRQQKNLSDSLSKADTAAFRQAAENVADRDLLPDPTARDAQARNVEKRAADLRGGGDLYLRIG